MMPKSVYELFTFKRVEKQLIILNIQYTKAEYRRGGEPFEIQ